MRNQDKYWVSSTVCAIYVEALKKWSKGRYKKNEIFEYP